PNHSARRGFSTGQFPCGGLAQGCAGRLLALPRGMPIHTHTSAPPWHLLRRQKLPVHAAPGIARPAAPQL
ncbi:hypothetical protein IW143_005282, partial [Coemansia sp. RSA 520]